MIKDKVQWKNGKVSNFTNWVSDALYRDPKEHNSIIRIGDVIHLWVNNERFIINNNDYICLLDNGDLQKEEYELPQNYIDALKEALEKGTNVCFNADSPFTFYNKETALQEIIKVIKQF